MAKNDPYFSGAVLYGDDFGAEDIAAWYRDEEEGYADLGARNSSTYQYSYHAWNQHLGYRHLPNKRLRQVLGFGSAYGDELQPVSRRTESFVIVDPSSAFVHETIGGRPVTYVRPTPSGVLPLPDEQFDLVTCLGVLHHIPNVSFVTSELSRVLAVGGHMLLREPIISMGDWRQPRRGLTKRERGIPLAILRRIIAGSGLEVIRESLCGFSLTPRLFRPFTDKPFNHREVVFVDRVLSSTFTWNLNYHATSIFAKLRPTSAFYVLAKQGSQAF